MFELLEASRDGADGAPEVTIRATGIAPVYDLANMLAAMTWEPCKQLGREVAAATGVALVSAVILQNEQVANAREDRERLRARINAEHRALERIADAIDGHRLFGTEAARELRLAIDPRTRYPDTESTDA